jgi:hypothetical protein
MPAGCETNTPPDCPVIEKSFAGFSLQEIIKVKPDVNSEHLNCENSFELWVKDTRDADPANHDYVKWEKLWNEMKDTLRQGGQGTLTDRLNGMDF